MINTCKHCNREIVLANEGWRDPMATGDDSIWSFTCDAAEDFLAEHELKK